MNIFLTVGSMLPFDRLVRAVDNWAEENRKMGVFAQIGESDYQPVNFAYLSKMTPSEFREQCKTCDLIISHAGMGTVITALECQKPLVVLPRRPELKEVTSSHQLATANWLVDIPSICVIDSEGELGSAVARMASFADKVEILTSNSHVELKTAIRQFIKKNLG